MTTKLKREARNAEQHAEREQLLTREQAAEFLNVRPQTLSVWACTKRYPIPFIKVGASVRYRLSDLEFFIASRTVTPNAEPVNA